MNKLLPSPRKFNFCLILGAAMLLLFVNSCKKEIYDVERLDPDRVSKMLAYKNGPKLEIINLSQFKTSANLSALGILKQELLTMPSSQQKTMSVNIPETFTGFQVLTDSIKVIRDKGHTIYVFPVKLSSKRSIAFQNLTIDESSNGTTAFVNTYTPSKKWIEEWKAGKAGKFDGDIGVTYLNLQNSSSLNIPVTGDISGNRKISAVNSAISLAQICNTTTYYYTIPYNCGSGKHGPGDSSCALTGEGAAGYVYITSSITTCFDVPEPSPSGGGGSTSPTPPGNYNPCDGGSSPPMISYNGATGAKLMRLPENPCDEEPLPQLPETPPPPTKEINNNLTDPCLKATISEALATNKDVKGFLSDLISKYAGLNNGIIINLSNANIGFPAETKSKFERDGTFTADIIFQNGYYNDVSKEAVVAALIHEVVHAYLLQTNSTYRNQPKDAQHNFLFTSFVHDIGTYFTSFVHDIGTYLINKYNMPSDNAYGLAWSGMGDVYNKAGDNDTFITAPASPATATSPAIPAKTMTKTELGGAVAPYKYKGTGSKGTPNCP